MKTDCHDTIGKVKSLFNSITMMNINIQIENPRIYLK
jgi:hypothetical protein